MAPEIHKHWLKLILQTEKLNKSIESQARLSLWPACYKLWSHWQLQNLLQWIGEDGKLVFVHGHLFLFLRIFWQRMASLRCPTQKPECYLWHSSFFPSSITSILVSSETSYLSISILSLPFHFLYHKPSAGYLGFLQYSQSGPPCLWFQLFINEEGESIWL